MKKIETECFVCGRKYEKCLREYNRNEKLQRPNCCSRTCSNRLPNRKRMLPQGKCPQCGSPKSSYAKIKLCKDCAHDKSMKIMKIGIFDWGNIKLCDIVPTLEKNIFSARTDYRYRHHSRIRDHSRYTYLHSDRPKCCCVCGYDKFVQVCHIKAVKNFPTDTLISTVNHIDNLVALCPNHHWEFDHGNLDISKYNGVSPLN